jgi:hypothetical protein
MPPTDRPIPRFVAEPPHELQPYGRWEQVLSLRFVEACEKLVLDPEPGTPESVSWFPERTYGGRTYVPAVAPLAEGEFFGYVSFRRVEADSKPDRVEEPQPEMYEPADFEVRVDYTEETAEQNPHWKLDLNEEVISRWRGPGGSTGDLTLVWGRPLVPGGVAVTAELGDETLDQCALVQNEGFTLLALDALSGFGDDLFLEIKLWSRRGELLALETLYEEEE